MYDIFFVLLANVQILLELLLFFLSFKNLYLFQLVYYLSKQVCKNIYLDRLITMYIDFPLS